jgi:hypothetical protein
MKLEPDLRELVLSLLVPNAAGRSELAPGAETILREAVELYDPRNKLLVERLLHDRGITLKLRKQRVLLPSKIDKVRPRAVIRP